MRIQELIDFASTLADQIPGVLETAGRLDEKSVQSFWATSQTRFSTWGAKLRSARTIFEEVGYDDAAGWHDFGPLFAEILLSDGVTRIWAALLHELDERLGLVEYSPIATSIVRGHEDARQRVVNLILQGAIARHETAIRLDGLRNAAERWADMLLAIAFDNASQSAYCHDRKRFEHFQAVCERGAPRRISNYQQSLRVACGSMSIMPIHVDLHLKLNREIMLALGPELRLSVAACGGEAWQHRIMCLTVDAASMLDDWQDSSDPSHVGDPSRPGDPGEPTRR